ncbi:MAG: hypothetical protein WD875_07180 [Pirellulales bacterium]
MTDRERWIVYPLLMMALGLALQPKITEVNARFGDVKCARLICDDVRSNQLQSNQLICGQLATQRAEVALQLDAARAKTRILSTEVMNAGGASIDAMSSNRIDTQGLRINDALGVRQAEIRASPHGGRIDIERYAHGGNLPFENRNIDTFVSDRQGNPIQLGVARVHLVAAEKPAEKPAENPAVDAPKTGTTPPTTLDGQDRP